MQKIFTVEGDEILIDDVDFDLVSKFKFRTIVYQKKYKRPVIKGSALGVANLILGHTDKGFYIDHVDRNPFNNTRDNLRIVTAQQNEWNKGKTKLNTTSKYKGVSWNKSRNVWVAKIRDNIGVAECIYIGGSERQAAIAYNKRAKELRGKFAVLNVID